MIGIPGAEIVPRTCGAPPRSLRKRSDERLVRIAYEGDERAFELLFERHGAAILRYCRSLLRAPQEAEDVRQEVFVLAISALRRGAEPRSFRPWLYRIAHNACVSHLRVRRPVLVGDDGMLACPGAAVEPSDAHREELRQLLDDIRQLPEAQRGALLLREMDGFSYEQVGEVLGVPQSTVRASIFRARRTLQGLAEARDADCQAIQSELCELADRRGRRNRRITAHLRVCPSCRSFRDALRRRPSILGVGPSAVGAFGPVGPILALKAKLFGSASAGGAGAAATAGGSAGVAKVTALVSTCAVLAAGSLEAERARDAGRQDRSVAARDAGGTPQRDRPSRTRHAAAVPSAAATGIARPTAATTAHGASWDTVAAPRVATVSHRRPAPDAPGERPARRRAHAVASHAAGAPAVPGAGSPARDGDDTGLPRARAERTAPGSRTPPRDGNDGREEHADEHATTQASGDGAWSEKTTAPAAGSSQAAPRERAEEDGGDSPSDAQGPAPAPAGTESVPSPTAPGPAPAAGPGENDQPEPGSTGPSDPGSTGPSDPPAGPPPDDAGMSSSQP